MEQTATQLQPPPLSATTAVIPAATTTAAVTVTHPDSVDTSPRSRNTNAWAEDGSLNPSKCSTAAAAPGGLTKLRLMCSYGGHIVPRPHDKSLCYVGGDTRIVVVDRHTTLSDLTNRLVKTLLRSSISSTTDSFTLKYQLPHEDLDSLIAVTTDEDLENMIDEYERLNSSSDFNKFSRLRLFLFPSKPKSVSSIGSLLESTYKSEDWFLNALNGTSSGFSDTSSVNCLLGLEEDVAIPDNKDVNNRGVIGKTLRGNNPVQDVQSVPDSPMLETSSFGSGSSSPSLANVPPIRVNLDDHKGVVIEEQFSKISVQQQHLKRQEDASFVAAPAPVVISGAPIGSKVAITENPNRAISEDERLEQSFQIMQQQQQPYQQKQSIVFDLASPDSISSDGSVPNPLSRPKPPVIFQDPVQQTQFTTNSNSRASIHDQTTRIQAQQQQFQDPAYRISTPTTQFYPEHPQLPHQPQFIHTAIPPPHYIHHHPSGPVPITSYYQMYPSHSQHHALHPTLNQPNLVYYTPGSPAPQLVQVPSNQHQFQPQFIGYSPHIHQTKSAAGGVGLGGTFSYEFVDPTQQGQHIHYAAQYQTKTSTLPVETGSHFQKDK